MSKIIKCLVWDLDETLWRGTLVEGDNLSLRPGILDLLKELKSRGILNSIASRNDEQKAIEVLKKFKIDQYFVAPQINYNLKADNLVIITKKLNIGMDSLAFIDDSSFERNGVLHSNPEVLVLNAKDYSQIINFPEFKVKNSTKESFQRSDYYRTEKERELAEVKFKGSRLEFLQSCLINMTLRLAKLTDIPRIIELSLRTNQFNSTRITLQKEEIEAMIDIEEYYVVIVDLKDKFGTYGNIGVMIIKIKKTTTVIQNFMISCRAAGRGISAAMMTHAMKIAENHYSEILLTDYRENNFNRQLGIFYTMMGFIASENQSPKEGSYLLYDLKLLGIPDIPEWIQLKTFND